MPKIKPTRLHDVELDRDVAEGAHVFFFHSNLTLGALGALVSDIHNSNAPKPVQSDIDLSDIANNLKQSNVSASCQHNRGNRDWQ